MSKPKGYFPRDGACCFNPMVDCQVCPPRIWNYCSEIPKKCTACGWNPNVAASRLRLLEIKKGVLSDGAQASHDRNQV